MAEALTQDYIQDHLRKVQSYDSWGRAIAHAILKHTQKEIGDGRQSEFSFDAKITVRPTPQNCIDVCVGIPPVQVCKHVDI